MSEVTGNLVETVEFRAIAPKSDLRGLDAALTKLTALDNALKLVQNRLLGLTTGSNFKLSAAQFTAKVPTKGAQDVAKLARAWGFPDVKDLQNVARQVENELQRSITRIQSKLDKLPARSATRGSTKARDALKAEIAALQAQSFFTDATASKFKNPTRAGQFAAEKYAPNLFTNKLDVNKAILGMLSGVPPASIPHGFPVQPGGPPPSAKAAPASSEEKVERVSKKVATAAGAFQDALEKIKLELAQNLNTGDGSKVASARASAAAQVQGLVESDSEGKVKQRVKDKALRYAADQERQAAQASQNVLTESSQNVFNLRKSLAQATKKGEQEKAKQLRAELDAEESRLAGLKQMDQVFYKPLQKQNAKRQQNAQRVAQLTQAQAQAEAARMANHEAVQKHWETFMAQPGAAETARSGRMTLGKDGRWTRLLEGQRPGPGGRMENFRADIGHEATFTRGFASAPVKHDKLNSALAGLNLRDMAANVIKVTTWATAVGVLYKSVQLAEYSMGRMMETGNKMAHLGIVFRGVGGNAQELTSDTIKLAAAQGRSTDEAMESAVEWARLGGDKATVNEQVRVSAMAANTADTDMLTTTKQLSALTHIYGLQASDLSGVLGMLTNTTLTYNIELKSMFDGLDRVAAAAKMAGMGLAEVQAMIGVVVGGTGQSGAVSGNAIKYILQSLNRDDVQKQLRLHGVETFTNKLEKKPAGQTLSELAGVWGTMSKRTQGELSSSLGGRFNAARIPIVLEHYPKILQLAIDGQLNLNRAQEANVAILDTLKANLAGFRAEWDRMVMNSGTMPFLSKSVAFAKNVLGDVADSAGSTIDDSKAKSAREKTMDGWLTPDSRSLPRRIPGKVMGTGQMALNSLAWARKFSPYGMLLNATGIGKHLPGDAMGPGLVDFYNYSHDKKNAPPGQSEYESHRIDIQKNMSANAMRRQSFTMARTMLENGTMTDENRNVFAETMQRMNGGQAMSTAFLNAKTKEQKLVIVDQAKMQSLKDLAAGKKEAYDTDQAQQQKLEKQQTALNETIKQKIAAGQAHGDESKQFDLVTAALEKNKKGLEELGEQYQEYLGQVETVMATIGKYIALAKMQADVMERISRMSSLVHANTPLGELDQQAAAAQEQVKFLTGQRDSIDNDPTYRDDSGKLTTEAEVLKLRLAEKITRAEAEYNAVTNPFERAAATRQGQMEEGVRAVDREASGTKYGYNEAEKLGRERSYLQDKIKSLPSDGNRSAQQEGEFMEANNRLFENRLDLLRREADLKRDALQLTIEQNREFQKGFMAAGPAEMMQKLAAFHMSFDDKGKKRPALSQGAFFAMSPEMRSNYGMLNPQFNPQMMELNREKKKLQDAIARMNADIPKPDKTITPHHVSQPATAKENPAGNAMQMAATVIENSSTRLARSLDTLATRVDGMFARMPGGGGGHSMPVNAQSGGAGGGKGFSSHPAYPGV